MENNNRQGCRWTKASERLPEVDGIYVTRNENGYVSEHYFDSKAITRWRYLNSNRQRTENVVVHKNFIIEWLDESIEPCATSSDAIQFAEWLMENNYKWEIDGLVGYCWYEENESGESKLYAAADLYKIYKSQTPSPTGDRDCEELKKEVERLKGERADLIKQLREFISAHEKGLLPNDFIYQDAKMTLNSMGE